jgi:hypothetical protein
VKIWLPYSLKKEVSGWVESATQQDTSSSTYLLKERNVEGFILSFSNVQKYCVIEDWTARRTKGEDLLKK